MAELYESYTVSPDSVRNASGGGTVRSGQTFTPQVTHVLTSVKLMLYRSTTELYGTAYCGIFATSGGLPTGSALVSAQINYGTMGTSWPGEAVEISFDPGVQVELGAMYAIGVWMTGGADSYSLLAASKMVGTYANGTEVVSDNGGSTWVTQAGDIWFEQYGEAPGEPCTIAAAGAVTASFSTVEFAPAFWPWTWPVVETLLFNTEILEGHDRTEQRIARHGGVPRQQFRTSILVEGDGEAAAFDAVLHGWLKRMWPVPLWPQAVRHTASLAAGTGEISLDTRYAEFHDDSYGLVWQGDLQRRSASGRYEILKIASVTDTGLTLGTDLAHDFIGGKWIMPLRQGYCLSAATKQRFLGGSALVEMAWLVVDADAVTGHVAAMSYDGLEILLEPAFVDGDAHREVHDGDVAVLDAGTGPFVVVSNSDENLIRQRHIWQCTTAARCWSLRQFLHAIRGPQTAFLVPTFRSDITLTRPAGTADTSLYVRNRGFTRNMGVNPLRIYVALRPALAPILVRKVAGLSVVSTAEEKIDLDAAPGQAFPAGETLSWVDKCRLADDAVEWQWRDRGELSCSVELVRVP
ncbi:MAG: hypothetical protein ABFE13_01500 [Phycisphaerales bacterium]